jgi:K+-transporting ATPase ATPase A chain
MMLGRFAFIVPMLAVAGALSLKTPAPASSGTFPTHTPLFVVLLMITVVVLGALTFFPVLMLGPIAEHVSMIAGQSF